MASFSERDIVEPATNELVRELIAQAMVASCFTLQVVTVERTDFGTRTEPLRFRILDISIGALDGSDPQPNRLFVTGRVVDPDDENFRIINFSPDPSQPEARTRLTVTVPEQSTGEPFDGPRIGY